MPTRKKSPKKPQPSLPPASAVELHRAPAVARFIEAVRKAVNAALDLADSAAAKVIKMLDA